MMALFLGAFLIYNTYQVAIIERQHDLAILRVIGAEKGQITRLILVESSIQGLIGSVIGLVVGILFSILLVKWVEASGWTTGVGNLDTRLSPTVALICASFGIGIALIAGFVPARLASKVSPLAALHPIEKNSEIVARWRLVVGIFGAVIAVGLLQDEATFMLGALLLLIVTVIISVTLIAPLSRLLHPLLRPLFPRVSDLALGNILRQPKRASAIVNSIIVGFAVFVASAVIVTNLTGFFTRLYQENFLSDILIFPLGGETVVFTGTALGVDATVARSLSTIPDVSAVSTLRSTTIVQAGETVYILGIDPQYAGELRPFRLYEGNHESAIFAMQEERAIYLNDHMAQIFNLGIGDSVTFDTPYNGLQSYNVVAIGDDIDIVPNVSGAMIANSWIETDFGVGTDVTIYLDVADDADMAQVMEQVNQMLVDYPQMVAVELSDFRETAINRGETISNFFYIMAVLVVIPSLFGLLNTVIMNVLERQREIGMLRAIGGNQAQVQRAFIVEMLYLSSIGVFLGAIVGIMLGLGMVQIWDTALTVRHALYGSVPVFEIVIGVALGLGLALFLTLTPARHASRENIVQVLRYE
jgi:putative ABC transport system permease protein